MRSPVTFLIALNCLYHQRSKRWPIFIIDFSLFHKAPNQNSHGTLQGKGLALKRRQSKYDE